MNNYLSPGKARALQTCATAQGIFTILAVDHRDSLRGLIDPEAPQAVSTAQLTELKLAVVRHLAEITSAILLDPLYSAAQAIVTGQLPGNVGLLCAMEEQGYLGDPNSRRSPMLAGWDVEKTKRLGANGVKILLFYHPDAGEATEAAEELVRSIAADCRRHDIPFFLEPISYSVDPEIKKGSPAFARLRRRIVIETVRRLSTLGPDVMKVEFPLDVHHDADQAVWAEACAELNDVCRTPWTLLSAGVPFDTFKEQLRLACQAGCSGFVGGRAMWKEAATLSGEARADFLVNVARQRFAEVQQVAVEYGMPWTRRFTPAPVDEEWFKQY